MNNVRRALDAPSTPGSGGSKEPSAPARAPLDPPRLTDGKPMLIAGLAERHRDSSAGIEAQWQRFLPHIGKIPRQVGRAAYGVVFDAFRDATRATYSFGYLTGVEVSDTARLPEGFGHLEIPAQRYAVFVHNDHVSALPRTIRAIVSRWLPESGHEAARDGIDLFERYGEAFDPQTGMGGVEVWLPLKR